MNALKFYFLLFSSVSLTFLSAQTIEPVDSLGWDSLARSYMDRVDQIKLLPDSNIQLVLRAQAAYKKAGNLNEFIMGFNHLSLYHYYKEDFDQAEINANAAMDMAAEFQGKEHKNYTLARGNQAVFLEKKGYYEKAINLFKEAIASREITNENRSPVAILYSNIAFAYISMGDYDEALFNLKNALRLRLEWTPENTAETTFNKAEIAGIYSDMGKCYREKGLLKESIVASKKSLILCDQVNSGQGSDYISQIAYISNYNLAENYLKRQEKDSTLFYIEKALKIAKEFEVWDDAYGYQVLAKLYQQEGNFELALIYFDKAIDAARKEAGSYEQFPQIAVMLTGKGKVLLEKEDYKEALSTFQSGLKSISSDFESMEIDENPTLDQIIHNLFALEIIKGKADAFLNIYLKESQALADLTKAEQHYQLAARLIQKIRQSYITSEAKNQLATSAVQIYEAGIRVFLLLYEQSREAHYLEQAFAFSENNKAISLMESINDGTAKIYAGLPDSLLEEEKVLNIELTYFENKIARAKNKNEQTDKRLISKLEQKQFDLKKSIQQLVRRFENTYPKYYDLKYRPANISLSEVQNRIPEETAILEYFIGEKHAFVFYLTKKGLKAYPVQLKNGWEEQVFHYYRTLSTPPSSNSFVSGYSEYTSSAYELYRILLKEGLEALPVDITKLIVIPDDLLGYLPFETFLVEKADNASADYSLDSLHYLIEDFKLSYAYSCALLFKETPVKKPEDLEIFLGFAPSFDNKEVASGRNCTDEALNYLTCNQQEIKMINELYPGKIFVDKQASKSQFFEEVSKYKIIHLATHACVDDNNAVLNKIYFADDYITNNDLYQLKLNADLVVLSACNTGAGKLVKGEGIMSLSRGFIHAGSSSVVMSLWSVDDCATSDIMVDYYKNLKNGKYKDEALWLSKRNYIQSTTDKARAHPYYWAPFIQYGDTEALNLQAAKVNLYLVSLAGLFVLILLFFGFKKRFSF